MYLKLVMKVIIATNQWVVVAKGCNNESCCKYLKALFLRIKPVLVSIQSRYDLSKNLVLLLKCVVIIANIEEIPYTMIFIQNK